MTDYPNWFLNGGAQRNFDRFLSGFRGLPIHALQIGTYTGDATKWLFENVLTHPESTLVDVDTWQGSDEVPHKAFDWKSVEEVYDQKIAEFAGTGRLIKAKGTSDDFFGTNQSYFDFIYVDGDHTAAAVLKDGVNAVRWLSPGGILAFDDYKWRSQKGPTYDPYPSIDAIVNAFKPDFEVLEVGLQVWLRRNS